MRIKRFHALHPPRELAEKVSCVPYDTVDTREARALAAGNPDSFLHVSRPEIDFPDGTNMYSDDCYAHAAKVFAELQRSGRLVRTAGESLYVYSITMGAHTQTGVVGCCHAGDYESGIIKRHERTRKDKEDDRARHIGRMRAHPGPVFLMYKDVAAIDRLVRAAQQAAPMLDVKAPGGTLHRVWPVTDSAAVEAVFAREVPVSYIADGHHRAAAAARVAAEQRAANAAHSGAEEYNWFLGVLFPASQLRVMPYNRLVKDLNGLTAAEFLARLKETFRITRGAKPEPAAPRNVSMYLGGEWYGLEWDVTAGDAVGALDVSVLQDRVLGPILGIDSPMHPRIEFIGGIRGVAALKDPIDRGEAAVAFSMYPVRVEEIMAIADEGRIMPAKSTWFEPKLRSALLIHTF